MYPTYSVPSFSQRRQINHKQFLDQALKTIISSKRNRAEIIARFDACLSDPPQNTLDLSSLGLSSMPEGVFPSVVPKLEFLSLGGNLFTKVPPSIKEAPNLKLINLSSNSLSHIDNEFDVFKDMHTLNLAQNQLTRVPDNLANLPYLAYLDLSGNPLDDDALPQNLWKIPQVELGHDGQGREHMMPVPFEFFSQDFADQWPSFEQEENAQHFKTWLYKLGAILLAGKTEHQRTYFSGVLSHLMDTMASDPKIRARCFSCAEEAVSTCRDRVLLSIFDMQILCVEEELLSGRLSSDEVMEHIEQLFHFYRLQEESVKFLGRLHKKSAQATSEPESLETALAFIASPKNTLSMPIDTQHIKMFYESVSKATDEAILESVTRIRKEKDDNPNYLNQFLPQQEFWQRFLYQRYAKDIDDVHTVFDDRMGQLDDRKQNMSDREYQKELAQLLQDKKDAESRLYARLTDLFITSQNQIQSMNKSFKRINF
jgi:hypothetical protein